MKFKLMSFLLFGFTIISCEKEVLKENQQTNFELTDESEQIIRSNSGIHEAFQTMTYDEARSAFQTLSKQETQSLHLSKMKEYANTLSLNAQKIECIKFLEKIVQNLPSSNEYKLQEELWLEK